MAPQPQPQFAKDEKALCFHHELLYEAKVLDVKQTDPSDKKSGFQYKVHYKGWKNTWDDWVPQDRLRKLTDENRELANNLRKEMEALRYRSPPPSKAPQAGKKRGVDRGSEERPSAGPRGQKRGRDFEVEKEESFQARPAVRIPMPDRLKSLLVDDWENISKNFQIVTLPAKQPASNILDEYAAQAKRKRVKAGSADVELLEEVIHGLKEYFNKALGRVLLYRFERQQYADIYKEVESPTSDLAGKSMGDIYSGAHLLRLLVSMPELIAQTNMDQQSINRLRAELSLLTLWMSQEANVVKYLTCEYENTSQDYKDKIIAGA